MKQARDRKILQRKYGMYTAVIVFIGVAKDMQWKRFPAGVSDISRSRVDRHGFDGITIDSTCAMHIHVTRDQQPSLTAMSIPTTCRGSGATVSGQLDAIGSADVDDFAEVLLPIQMFRSHRKRYRTR